MAEVAEDVDEVEGEPGGHEHEDHADQEVHRPLTSGVASAGGGGGAGPGPEGKLDQIISSLNLLYHHITEEFRKQVYGGHLCQLMVDRCMH